MAIVRRYRPLGRYNRTLMPCATSSLLYRLVAVILAAGVSLCCCRTNALAHAAASPGPVVAACGAPSGPACCRAPAAPSPDRERDPEPFGCKTCCVKGTGLKDAHPDLPARLAAVLPPLLPRVEIVLEPAAPPAPSPRRAAPAHAGPLTLLRLRCALIV